MKKLYRFLAALFGAVLFGIIVPIAYLFAFDQLPLDGFKGILLLIGVGLIFGAILGALFPRVFGFVFEAFIEM